MKYKIGDRVLVIDDTFYTEKQIGKTGTIVKVELEIYHVVIDGEDYSRWLSTPQAHVYWERELANAKEINIPILLSNDKCMPTYGSKKAAGADLRASINYIVILKPLCRAIIPTGVRLELPAGYEAQIRPRSGLAAKLGLTVLNSPGTIDEDYRGEIKVILVNLSTEEITITPNERIAQIVIAPYVQGVFQTKEELTETLRGESGLGSTGTA